MHTDKIHMVGAGGHARVVLDALLRLGHLTENISVYTEIDAEAGGILGGIRIKRIDDDIHAGAWFHVAVGNNHVRARLHRRLVGLGAHALTVVHPDSTVALDGEIGQGTLVAAGAVIGPAAKIGAGCIINHGAIVDHDCRVSDFSHIAPRGVLTGAVTIGRSVLVGAGAVIQPGFTVADEAIIGSAAMVNVDVPAHAVYIGVPARRIR